VPWLAGALHFLKENLMSAKFPSGMPPGLKEAILAGLAQKLPGISLEDIEIISVGQEDAAEPDDIKAASGGDGDGMAQHRYHLVERVMDNLCDESWTATEVVQAADVLFQYITNGTVPA
jgi:hypothetical protein